MWYKVRAKVSTGDFGPWTDAALVAWPGIPTDLKKKALTFSGAKVIVSLEWKAPNLNGLTLSKYHVQHSTDNVSYADINSDGLTSGVEVD